MIDGDAQAGTAVASTAAASWRWALVAQGIVAGTSLAGSTIFARFLGPHEFGSFFVALTVSACMAVLVDACAYQAVLTRAPHADQHVRNWELILGIAGFLGALATLLGYAIVASPAVPAAWVILTLSVPLSLMSMMPRAMMLLAGRVRGAAIIDITVTLGAYAVVVPAVVWTHSLTCAALAPALIAVGRLVFFHRAHQPTPGLTPRAMKESACALLPHLAGTYPSQVSGFFSRTADNLIVSAMLGATSLGFYSRAYSLLVGPVLQIQMAVNGLVLRDLARLPAGLIRQRLEAIGLIMLIGVVPGATILGCLQTTVSDALFGPAWAEAGRLLGFFALLTIWLVIALPARWFYLATGNAGRLRIDSVLQITMLAGVAIGVAWGGLRGSVAINATVVGPLIALVEWAMMPERELRSMLWRVFVPVAATLALVTAAPLIALRHYVELGGATVVAIAAAWWLVISWAAWHIYASRRKRHAT